MLINTKFLGKIEIDEKMIIDFENGLPGFNELHKFVVLDMEENPSLQYMQSIEKEEICFIVISPFAVMEDYEADLSEETVQKLVIENAEEVSLYAILTIPEDIKEITVNLIAPIIVNNVNNKAIQEIINNDKYSIRHKLFREE
ncbi:MAG: fliW [Clostridia bacterium]|jgi:flagellar assembly factor FliW|nr:fliW [Clostridia bacterium]